MAQATRKLNKEFYHALMKGDTEKVILMCGRILKGPLHTFTIHQDTVLHMAAYSQQKDLAIKLLNLVPEVYCHKLVCQNDVGNTMLHEAASSDIMVSAAMEMLRKAPTLLSMPNRRGETPIFHAAQYGNNNMYTFLDAEMHKTNQSDADLRNFHFRNDKTSILHISILNERYDLAFEIAAKYSYLIDERDGDGMTALQLLACNPSAFHGGGRTPSALKELVYARISTKGTAIKEGCRVPLWEQIRDRKLRYESVRELAMFLIERDSTWEATESALNKSKPKSHKYGRTSMALHSRGQILTADQETTRVRTAETPLFLATKTGCTEIVSKILEMYPQAVEHVDDEGRNILHVAIKYRQIQIFDMVEKMGTPMKRLIQKITNKGNSILHMVALKATEAGYEDMRSPAIILQQDLLLFERVKKISSADLTKHYNARRLTAEMLFANNNAQLRIEAKEWMKGTAENCTIVAVLIATVAFAAAYTVPGGPNQETGYPILENQPFFFLFMMTDVLSLAFALTSVIIFLNILTSPFRLKDFQQSLPQKLMLGVTLLILSVSMMMLAFAATVILLISNKEKWTRVLLYLVAFFPVIIFAFSYLPLYISLMKTFTYSLKKIGSVVPRCDYSDPGKTDAAIISHAISDSTYQTQFSTPQTSRSLV